MTGMTSSKKGQPKNTEEAQSNKQPNSQCKVQINAITVNVFFDGTGNNMYNTEHRLKDDAKVDAEYNAIDRNLDLDNLQDREKIQATREAIRNKRGDYANLSQEISYNNDYSNVALLYMGAEIKDKIKRVYIEGAGTIKNAKDDQGGLAAATGESGIIDRVFDAFKQSTQELKETKANRLIFNVFGFSRGAFYGRYFCALLKTKYTEQQREEALAQAAQKEAAAQKKAAQDQTALEQRKQQQTKYDTTPTATPEDPSWLERAGSSVWSGIKSTVQYVIVEPVMLIYKVANNITPFTDSIPIYTGGYKTQNTGRALLNYPPENISINLVGIYDTVASHGWKHHDDGIAFKLDIGLEQQYIKKVLHITAKNEYRNHFALVSINTALNNKNLDCHPVGFQCCLPGAHADIGGGYIKDWAEKDVYLSNYGEPANARWWQTDAGEIHWTWFYGKGYYAVDNEQQTYDSIRKNQRQIDQLNQQIADKQAAGQDITADQEQLRNLEAQKATALRNFANQSSQLSQLEQEIASKQAQGIDVTEQQQQLQSLKQTLADQQATKQQQAEARKLQEVQGEVFIDEESNINYPFACEDGDYGEFRVVSNISYTLQRRYKVRANRIFNENAYQYVGLKLMHDLAKDDYLKALEFSDFSGKQLLNESFNEINANTILAKYTKGAIAKAQANFKTNNDEFFDLLFEEFLDPQEAKYLYHDFVHNSITPEFSFNINKFTREYLTNGSADYNKDNNFDPIRVMLYDNDDGVQNEKIPDRYKQGNTMPTTKFDETTTPPPQPPSPLPMGQEEACTTALTEEIIERGST